jgi:hypothetical protein
LRGANMTGARGHRKDRNFYGLHRGVGGKFLFYSKQTRALRIVTRQYALASGRVFSARCDR